MSTPNRPKTKEEKSGKKEMRRRICCFLVSTRLSCSIAWRWSWNNQNIHLPRKPSDSSFLVNGAYHSSHYRWNLSRLLLRWFQKSSQSPFFPPQVNPKIDLRRRVWTPPVQSESDCDGESIFEHGGGAARGEEEFEGFFGWSWKFLHIRGRRWRSASVVLSITV